MEVNGGALVNPTVAAVGIDERGRLLDEARRWQAAPRPPERPMRHDGGGQSCARHRGGPSEFSRGCALPDWRWRRARPLPDTAQTYRSGPLASGGAHAFE